MRPIQGTITDPAVTAALFAAPKPEPEPELPLHTFRYDGVFRAARFFDVRRGVHGDVLLVGKELLRGEYVHDEPLTKSYRASEVTDLDSSFGQSTAASRLSAAASIA